MPLPKNNLPSSSQQWAREIEKQLTALNNAVAINNKNNSSKDSTNNSNGASLSSLLLDQAELRSYSTEMPGTRSNTFVGGGFKFIDVTNLTQTININKERTALISYSSSYSAITDFLVSDTGYNWYVYVQLFVNGVRVGYTTVNKSKSINTGTNPYTQEKETGQVTLNKLVRLSAGSNTISVILDTGHSGDGSPLVTGTISVSDDDLSIDIIK